MSRGKGYLNQELEEERREPGRCLWVEGGTGVKSPGRFGSLAGAWGLEAGPSDRGAGGGDEARGVSGRSCEGFQAIVSSWLLL